MLHRICVVFILGMVLVFLAMPNAYAQMGGDNISWILNLIFYLVLLYAIVQVIRTNRSVQRIEQKLGIARALLAQSQES
jgi:uncharacterized membrane protein